MSSETPPSQSQTGASRPDVARELADLRSENQDLRQKLDRIEKRAELAAAGRRRAWGFTWRILVPLLDRKKVVRNFTKLASTTAEFVGPPDSWPSRDRVLKDANDFMTSVVRFIIRRRLFFLLFTIIATSIPFIQVYLVIQQNDLLKQTNALFQVQVNDMIARAMTDDDDPNTRRMAVALLANARIDLMKGVVNEIFDPEIAESRVQADTESARTKVRKQRVREAGFRAHLMRSVARSVHNRGVEGDDVLELYELSHEMFQTILQDTAIRLPPLMDITPGQVSSIKDEFLQEANFYVFNVGYVLRQYGRLARKVGSNRRFYRDITGVLQSAARIDARNSYFADVYRQAVEEFLIDVGKSGRLGASSNVLKGGDDIDAVMRAGFDRLKNGVGEKALDWQRLAREWRIK